MKLFAHAIRIKYITLLPSDWSFTLLVLEEVDVDEV